MEAHRDDVEAWKKDPWSKLPTWGKWTAGVVGALVLLVIGAAIGSGGEEDELKAELAETRTELAAAERAQADAEATAENVHSRRDQIVAGAKSRAAKIVGDARSESAQLSGKLERLNGEVSATEGELSSVEDSLDGAREEKAKSTIPGDGTFQAEVDYLPGTYQSSGGAGCYWATLNSADPFDIASNENATGQTIASISTPYFQTEDCGTWKRIGD